MSIKAIESTLRISCSTLTATDHALQDNVSISLEKENSVETILFTISFNNQSKNVQNLNKFTFEPPVIYLADHGNWPIQLGHTDHRIDIIKAGLVNK
jgi:hypothetical protein